MAVTVESVSTQALNIFLMIAAVVTSGGLITGIIFFGRHLLRYRQYKCIIWERDGFGQLKQTYDMAGIFVDRKTKNKRLFLKKNKVGLNPDSIPYLQSNKSKTIYLYKTGLKNFHYIKVNFNDPKQTLTVGEEDVNWSINAYERQKKLFQSSLLLQLMPFIALAFVSIMILIIFIYFFKEFSSLKDFALIMREVADKLAQIKSGTTIIPS